MRATAGWCASLFKPRLNKRFTLSGLSIIIKSSNYIVIRITKGGDIMGMTNKQFQGFIRLALAQIERALKETPDNKELQELKDIFQSMLEDD